MERVVLGQRDQGASLISPVRIDGHKVMRVAGQGGFGPDRGIVGTHLVEYDLLIARRSVYLVPPYATHTLFCTAQASCTRL